MNARHKYYKGPPLVSFVVVWENNDLNKKESRLRLWNITV